MKRFFFSFVSVLSLFFLACAGTQEIEERSSGESFSSAGNGNLDVSLQEQPAQQHFLWKVSDDNSSLWVLGSVHFADSSFYPLDSVIETAFVNAEEIAVEINMSDDSVSNEVATQSMKQGILPSGTTLNNVLPRSMWNSLDSLCASWNFPIAGIMRMRPWFAAMTLSAIAIQRTGIDPEYGVDVVLLERASEEGKTIVALETAEDQIGAVADTSDSDSAGIFYLKSTLREIAGLDSMVTQMMRAWKTGNDSLLRVVMNGDDSEEEISAADSSLQKNIEDKIYTSRNEKMAESIAQFLAEDRNVFVVVGAAHLALDNDNVIDLLKRRGLKVERF